MRIVREGKHVYVDGTLKGYWVDFNHNDTAYYGSIVKVEGAEFPMDTEFAIFRGQKASTIGVPVELLNGLTVKRKTLIEYIQKFCKEQGGVDDEWDE